MRYHPLPKTSVPVVALATLVLVMWIGWGSVRSPASFWAPGDLSRYHVDKAGCTSCHEPFQGPTAARCIGCHSEGSFEHRATPAVGTWHRDLVAERTACTGCHTEHRGSSARITGQTKMNPHDDLVFRATGASSCTACHEIGARVVTNFTLRDVSIVRRLYEQGRGAHQRGSMAECLACHSTGH